jgi:hypothetical protein
MNAETLKNIQIVGSELYIGTYVVRPSISECHAMNGRGKAV